MTRPNPTSDGILLASRLQLYRNRGPLVISVGPKEAPAAGALADELDAPLDFIVAEPFRRPVEHGELVGAVSETGHVALDSEGAGEAETQLADAIVQHVFHLLGEREKRAPGSAVPEVGGRIVILVGDGLATGSTMVAALRGMRAAGPARLVAAVVSATERAVERLKAEADEVVCLEVADSLGGVGRAVARWR